MGEANAIQFFLKHLVPIVFLFSNDTKKFPYVVTSFVLSVGDDWFLITAGHCLEKIEKEYKPAGYKIQECYLMDSLGLGAAHNEPIPFTYEQENPLYFPGDRERDYGMILLSPYYKELLERNNIVPLSEEVWKHQPNNPEDFILIGVPDEFTSLEAKHLNLTSVMNYIEKCDKPEFLDETKSPLFYGKITMSPEHKDVAGMSGGPILAIEKVNNEPRYWIVAVQSSWLPESKIVIGCPITFLGLVLEDALKRKYGG